MKRIVAIIAAISCMFVLCGCAKLIAEEYSTVSVLVVDSHYTPARIMPVTAGKVRTFVTHPARYYICVEYDGIEYSISGSDTYSRFKDKIGETANAQLRTRTYDDGTIKRDIISLD